MRKKDDLLASVWFEEDYWDEFRDTIYTSLYLGFIFIGNRKNVSVYAWEISLFNLKAISDKWWEQIFWILNLYTHIFLIMYLKNIMKVK
jgi:hypothetical protein